MVTVRLLIVLPVGAVIVNIDVDSVPVPLNDREYFRYSEREYSEMISHDMI